MKAYLNDPETGKPSVTLTAFWLGFIVATVKLLLSGIAIGTVTLSQFGGGDFAAAVGAVAALYWARRNASIGSSDQ